MAYTKKLRYPTGWALLKSTAPATPYPDDIAYASAVTNDTWSDRSVAVYKFPAFSLDVFHTFLFGRIGVAGTLLSTHSDLPNGLGSSSTSGWGSRFEYASLVGVSTVFRQYVRVFPIFADFNHLTLTWNTRSGLDEGPAIDLIQFRNTYSFSTIIGGNPAFDTETKDEAFSPTQLDGLTFVPHSSTTDVSGELTEPGIKVPAYLDRTACYGFVLETKARTNRVPPANPSLDTEECWFGLQPYKDVA